MTIMYTEYLRIKDPDHTNEGWTPIYRDRPHCCPLLPGMSVMLKTHSKDESSKPVLAVISRGEEPALVDLGESICGTDWKAIGFRTEI